MKRILPLLTILSGLVLNAQAAQKTPNIIFLLTDDQRWNAVGFMGNTEIKTPNLDQLAADGLVFENHFNTTSICMPSRATIMTGQPEYVHGVSFQRGNMQPDTWQKTYPVRIREAGYFTGFAGKIGFYIDYPGTHKNKDKFAMLPAGDFDMWAGWPDQGGYNAARMRGLEKYSEEFPHTTRALGAFGRDFIQTAKKQDKPFCLSISFKAPHSPTNPDPAFDDLYKDVTFSKPENFGIENSDALAPQSKLGRQRQDYWERHYSTDSNYQTNINLYYRQIYGIDKAVGMIRDELKAQGLDQDTVVIFTSDNGYYLGSHGFGGKVLPYEDGTHVPMVIYDPSRKGTHGKRAKGVTSGIDIAPTILSYAGLPVPADMHGVPLQPMLDNPEHRVRDQLLQIQVWSNIQTATLGVVTEKYRYNYWLYGEEGMPPSEELFDRINDPNETRNVIDNPEYTEVLQKMLKHYSRNLDQWKALRNKEQGYHGYDILADQSISWQKKNFLRKPKEGQSVVKEESP